MKDIFEDTPFDDLPEELPHSKIPIEQTIYELHMAAETAQRASQALRGFAEAAYLLATVIKVNTYCELDDERDDDFNTEEYPYL